MSQLGLALPAVGMLVLNLANRSLTAGWEDPDAILRESDLKLTEALRLLHAPAPEEAQPYRFRLVTGFESLHLKTFLAAHLRQRLSTQPGDRPVEAETGIFGDFAGNLEKTIEASDSWPVIAVLEWSDLHPALGWRAATYPASWNEDSALAEIEAYLQRLTAALRIQAGKRVVFALPAVPLPPWIERGLEGQEPQFVLHLRAMLGRFAAEASRLNARIAAPFRLEAWDPARELATGYPYTLEYSNELARRLSGLVLLPTAKKGLITDLDQTLWRGIVGDDGPEKVCWDLDGNARIHGWWQQFLGSLCSQGILVGVASKNDPGPVQKAFERSDLLISPESLFPLEVNWQEKAAGISRIVAAWNVGLDSVVFVDDNPLELESVRRALPQVECVLFPAGDPAAAAETLSRLRSLFGKEFVTEEDRLRASTLRQREGFEHTANGVGSATTEEVIARLNARCRMDLRTPPEPRALELINKTNQFNLNGRRWEESGWADWLRAPHSRVLMVGYEDRFGPLGNIAVVAAEQEGDESLFVRSWVMSCRAFSRRIEFATLRFLAERWPTRFIRLDWRRTERNGPTAEALKTFLGELPEQGELCLGRVEMLDRLPALYFESPRVLETN